MLYIDGIHKRIEFVREVLAKPKNQKRMTWGAIVVVFLCLIFSIFSMFYQTKHVRAALSNCTYTNAAGTNFWNNAGNWSCGNVPTNSNNVIFDGAVSSAPVAIDVAATAASFTTKGTNLPTTGDIAYTGTITANQNLTLDTTNAGTGSFYLGAATYVANATTITVPGNWTSGTGYGAFTYGTSTINLTGTGSITPGTFYNLTAAAAGKTTTIVTGATIIVKNVLTTGNATGAWAGSGYTVQLDGGGTPFVNGGNNPSMILYDGTGAINVAGGTYWTASFPCTSNASYTLTGNMTITSNMTISFGTASYTVNFDTNGYSYTSAGLQIGSGATYGIANFKPLAGGAINITGNISIGAGDSLDLSSFSGTFSLAGNWTNSGTFATGSSTVNFTGAGTQAVNSGGIGAGKMFYNLIHSGTGIFQLTTNSINIDGNFSQTAGTFNSNALNQTFAKDFSLSAGTTYTKGGTLTFDGTTSYSDLNATPQNIGAVTLNGTSLTIASGTMQTDALTVTVGSLIQTAGNIKTTGAVSVAASQNWTNNGTGDVTLGGNVTNAGTVTFNGDEAGGQDSISILSSAASARTWTLTGAGSFSFTDVSVVYQTGAAPVTATSSNDGGNNVNWTFATNRVISGSLYNGIGGSKITAAKHIHVSVNGAAASSTDTDGTGNYTLTLGGDLAANDKVAVFVSGETEKASAITKTSIAASGINIDLFQNYTVVRHEGTIASIAYADLAIADDLADSDLLFSVDGSNIATFTQGVYIMGNKTYNPGANTILNTGSWANYGSLGVGNSVSFTATTGTQTVFSSDTAASPYTGVGKAFNNLTHSGAGTLQLTSNLNVDGTLTNSSGPLDCNSLNIFAAGAVTMTGSTITNSGTLTFDGTLGQTFTTAGLTYNNITLNNTGTAGANERITVTGNLDINGALTITDGSLYLVTSNPNVNTAGAVTIASTGLVNKGTGTWTFDGTTTFTDNEATKSNIGPVVINGTSCTLASSMTVDTMTVTSGTLNLGTGGYTLKLANAGSTANVLSVAGTLTVGTSTIQYAAVNSGGNINILTIPYSSLQFTPVSGSESYDMTGSLTSGNAMTGSVTIDASATLNTYVGTTSYDVSCVDITINTSGTLYAGTNGSAGTSTYNISRNWNQANGTFTYGMSTVNMTGTGTITGSNAKPVYKMNAAAAGQTTTLATNLSFALVNVLTLGTGSLAGTGANTGFILAGSIATPLVTGGATMNIPLTYYPSTVTQNITATTYQNLIFNSTSTANLAGDITAQAITISRAGGGPTVNANTHNINCTSLILGAVTTNYSSTLNMGSGTLTVSGDVNIYASDGSNANTLIFTSGTMNIAGNFIDSDVFTYGTSTVNFNGTTPTTISGTTANTFYNLTATAGKTIIFPAGVTQTIAASGSLNLNGSTAGMVHLRSSSPGTRWNISVPANQAVSYVDVKDSAQTNGTYTITDTNGNDGGNNNVYWVFSGTGNRYWVAPADGNWNSAANWSASSGGAANASIPTSGNTAIFDQAAGAGSYACTINTVVTVDNISVATYTNTITVNALTTTNTDINMSSGTITATNAGTVNVNGDLLLSGTAVFTAPNTLNLAGNFTNSGTFTPGTGTTFFTSTSPTAKTITSGSAHFYNLIFNGTGGSWNFGDDPTIDNNFTIATGTVDGTTRTLNVGASWTVSAATATFIRSTSTVNMTGTGTITMGNASGKDFYNLTCAATGKVTTFPSEEHAVYNVLTVGTGTLTGGLTTYLKKGSGSPFATSGATLTSTTMDFALSGSATTVAAATYNTMVFRGTGTANLAGNITASSLNVSQYAGGTATADTNGYNITVTTLSIGGGSTVYGVLKNTSGSVSTITVNGNITNTVGTVPGTNQFLANNMNISLTGNWTNTDLFTAGNSTVNFTGAGTQTLNSGGVGAGKLFNNLTHSGAGTLQLLTNAYEVDGTFSQTAGTFNANALAQTYKGNFSLSAGTTYTKGSTLTFGGTTSYSDANTSPQNIGAVTLNGTSLTVASGTMATDTITVTTGSLIQTAGNISTTGAVSVAASQNWTNNGGGDVTLGGNVTNAGTLSFNGDEATYGQDPITIASTAASNRTWTLTGAGSFSFTDVSVSYQTGAATITATSSNDGGNNVNWVFATTKVISGYLYNGIGGSLITAVKTIAVSVNGAAATTTTTDGTGFYTLTLASLPANNTVGVFVSGDAGTKASAITKTAATADIGINIDLFQNYSVLRHEGATTSLTNTDLDTADNVGDADLLETVTASVPTFTQGIYILNNKVYAPGNNIVVQGNFANYGTFTNSTYTVTFDGTGTVLGTTTTSFTNVTINNTKTLTGHATDMNVSGNFLNNGTFTHNSGTLTFNGTVGQTFTDGGQSYNNIILNNTGTAGANERITVSGNLDINGNLTITDGALYLVTNNPTVNIAGNTAIAAAGIVTKGSGAWTFDGAAASTFSDLEATVSNLGAVTLNKTDAGTPATNDLLTVTSNMKTDNLTIDGTSGQEDTLSIATTKTVTVTAGSTTTINSGATISGAGTLILTDTAGANLSTTGTLSSLVQFNTATADVTIPARTYGGDVTVYNNTSTNYNAVLGTAGSQTINFSGNLTLTTNSTGKIMLTAAANNPIVNIAGNFWGGWASGKGNKNFNLGTSTWTVGGNWTAASADSATTTNTIIFNGNGKTVTTNETYESTIIRGNITFSGQYYVGGTAQSFTIDAGFTATITGRLFFGTVSATLTLNGNITGSGTLEFGGVNTGTLLNGNGVISVNTINFSNGCANSTIPGRSYYGNVTAYTWNCASSPYTVIFGKNNGETINIYGNLTLSDTGSGNITFDANTYNTTINVTGNLTTSKSSTGIPYVNLGSSAWNVGGNVDFSTATVTPGASTLTMNNVNGLVTQTLDDNDQTFNNLTHSGAGTLQLINHALTLNGTLTNSAGFFNANNLDLTIAGSLNNTATLTNFSTNTTTFNSDSGSIQTSGSGINNLTVNHTGGSYQLSDALMANGNVTITAGTLDANGNNMTVGGNWNNADTFTPGANTVTFNKSSGTQTLNSGGVAAGKLFNNVTHSGAGTLQLITNTLNVDGNFVNSGGTLDTNSQNVTLAGNFNSTGGTVTTGSSTVTFDGAVAQSITSASQPFYNLTLSNSGTGTGDDITPADALNIEGTLTVTDGQIRLDTNNINTTIAGDLTIASGGTWTKGSGTTTFDGNITASTLTDSASGGPYNLGAIAVNKNNIVTPAANLLTLASATSIDSMTIAASNILATAGFAITDSGNWTNNGTFTAGAGTVTFDGTSTVLGTQATTFNNLTINNTKSLTGHATNMNMAGNYLNNGTFTSGTGTVTLNGAAAQSLTAGGTDDDHDLYNLIITNSAGPTNGVTFADSLTLHAGGTFTDTTPNSKLIFTTGATYNFPIIVINGSGAGDVTMTTTGGVWNFIVPGTPAVTYVTVDHSDATGSGAEIDATNNCHDGGSNTYWNFAPPFTPSISFSIDSNAVTFANLNASNSWTDTKTNTVTTTTNAPSGYTVRVYLTQSLTSLAYPAQTIANYAGTWTTPTTWSGYGFGYTSNDPSVQGSDRFGSGTKFAGFTQTPSGDIAADNNTVATAEAFIITYKVAVTDFQTASTYRTYAIYIATANF